MNDAFWNSLPATITAFAACIAAVTGMLAAIFSFLNGYFGRKSAKELKDGLQANTDETVNGRLEVVKEVKSATREVSEHATQIKDETASQVIKTAAELAEKQDHLEVTINGRMDQKLKQRELVGYQRGLLEANKLIGAHASRIEALETGYAEVVRGQVDIVKSINHFAEVIERKMV